MGQIEVTLYFVIDYMLETTKTVTERVKRKPFPLNLSLASAHKRPPASWPLLLLAFAIATPKVAKVCFRAKVLCGKIGIVFTIS